MPNPCMNCIRFHYGVCREPPRFCFVCGGINHIERYCPNQKHTIQRVPGEPLAGTVPWQEMRGLQHDPVLKAKVLQSLKASPGTGIHVNVVCIYRGYEKHFVNQEEPRASGNDTDEHRGRIRSRSPGFGRLSRSLPRHGNCSSYQDPQIRGYRQRSPIRRERRRTPSPYRHASPPSFYQLPLVSRSPRLTDGSNAIVVKARQKANRSNRRGQHNSGGIIGSGQGLGFLPLEPREGVERRPQQVLRESSANIRAHVKPPKLQQGRHVHQYAAACERTIEDPHFVLGIKKGAGDAEIIYAHQERTREVEAERAIELDIDMELNNDYGESIRLLDAAKTQLLNHKHSDSTLLQ